MEKYILSDNDFSLEKNDLLLNETLFHNANGYIGVRSNFEEGYPDGYPSIRGMYINGFYNIIEMPQAEKLYGLVDEKQTMLNVADTQAIKLVVDGESFDIFDGKVITKERILDMKKGVTIRHIVWESPCGKQIDLQVTRMTSFSVLPLFLIKYCVTPLNFSGTIEIISKHIGEVSNFADVSDPRVAAEAVQHLVPVDTEIVSGISCITSKTTNSNLFMCSAVSNVIDKEGKSRWEQEDNTIKEIFSLDAAQGETTVLHKYTILMDSLRYSDVKKEAVALMTEVTGRDVNTLYEEQEEYLERFWRNTAFSVEGDQELNRAMHFNMYQLIQSASKDAKGNITAKGLSGEGYEGHYFWDTEMYIQPFFILNEPEIAKNLIRYRYEILGYAKENARIMGHAKGALYPWRTIMGRECSGYFPSGSAAYHINGDIAYAIVEYYLATKDIHLLEECGAEILIETARLWIDTGNYVNGKFYINGVTGPDEYTCMVNNNYYTNAVAQHNLKWAVKAIALLKAEGLEKRVCKKTELSEEELQAFADAAEHMYLPYDEALGINPQDDSFLQKEVWLAKDIPAEKKPLLLHYHPMYLYRHQICKQADTVLAHFILEDITDLQTMRKSFDYYEPITTHDSSLSCCIFSIVASKLGLHEKAYEYFGESAKLDLFNTHKNTKDGIHTANMGGSYMAFIYGFAGLRIKEQGIFLAPHLPEQWDGYQFRIFYENSKIQVEVSKKECVITLIEGAEKEIHVFGEKYCLKDKLVIVGE